MCSSDLFPAVALARRAGTAGGTAPAVFNGADEACVAAFMDGRLPFLGIVDTVARVLEEHLGGAAEMPWVDGNNATLENVFSADGWARARAAELVEAREREA